MPSDAGLLPLIDPRLGDRNDGERSRSNEKTESDLANRIQRPDKIDGRVHHKLEEWDKEQDQNRIDGLNLRGKPCHPEPLPVHIFCLKHPGRSGLVEQGPEDCDKQEDHGDLGDGLETFRTESFLDPFISTGRNVNEDVSPHPEEQSSNRHQDTRNTECPMRAIPVQQPRCQQGGDKRSQVDGEIEPAECLGQKVCILFAKLITHMGTDTGLDSP